MNVLFISDVSIENPSSGAEQVLFHQATGLVKEGMRVWALIRDNRSATSPAADTVSGVQMIRFKASVDNFLCFCKSVFRFPINRFDAAAEANPFDVVIAHQPLNYCFLSGAGRLKNIPLIYNFHSPWHQEYLLMREEIPKIVKICPALIRKYLERICLRKAKKIMVLSRYMQRKLQSIHATAADRILLNPGGVDTIRFKCTAGREEWKHKLGLPPESVHLLTVRNLEPRMGLDRLLQSMVILKKKYLPVHLVMAGEGIERARLQALIDHLDLGDTVRMEGFIPAGQLPGYYAAADFFIMPTRDLEGFGLVTPESLACGTPVLGTPIGGTLEILEKLDSDLLFKDTSPEAMAEGIRQAIRQFFNDRTSYAVLRKRCRKYAENRYSWQRHIRQLVTIIQSSHLPAASYQN